MNARAAKPKKSGMPQYLQAALLHRSQNPTAASRHSMSSPPKKMPTTNKDGKKSQSSMKATSAGPATTLSVKITLSIGTNYEPAAF